MLQLGLTLQQVQVGSGFGGNHVEDQQLVRRNNQDIRASKFAAPKHARYVMGLTWNENGGLLPQGLYLPVEHQGHFDGAVGEDLQ